MKLPDRDAVPRLALGCAAFGGVGSLPELAGRGEDRESAFRLMDAAWAGGIRTLDTADAYGVGLSEQWIGDWIEASGNRPRVTTKTYNPMPPANDAGLSRERVARQIDGSLERLRIDRIDLYLAHEFDPLTPVSETFDAFERLIEGGLIAAYGVSNFSASQLELALQAGRPSVIQNSYSLLNRRDEVDVIPLAREHGLAYQAYSPMAGGWLSGRYRQGEPFPSGSRLALVPQWYEHIDTGRAFAALAQMEELAAEARTSVAALAQGWVLAQPDVAGMVVGPRRVEHLLPTWEAQDGLAPAIVERLAAIYGG